MGPNNDKELIEQLFDLDGNGVLDENEKALMEQYLSGEKGAVAEA